VVVSEQPGRFAGDEALPEGCELRHRDQLSAVQEELRAQDGVTVLVYDQTCAAEKRRRRKVAAYPDPARRLFINPWVCEGCGDCSAESNCLAIQPLETELGRKRRIDQSACNKDYSCVKGFCPSFVTVEGGRPRRTPAKAAEPPYLDEPSVPPMGDAFDMVIAGIGGTGVVTVSAIVGMAARIEGMGVALYDSTGLSQKGGQVFSHVRLRRSTGAVVPARVGPEEAHVLLACDLVAAVQPEALNTVAAGKTCVVANSDVTATADFQVHRDRTIAQTLLTTRLEAASARRPLLLPASSLSEELFGDSISANLLMLGFAWQRGEIPLSRGSIEQAIALNGKAVEQNLRAFEAGRLAASRPAELPARPLSLDEFVSRRETDLEQYWNAGYAARYSELMARVRAAAARVEGGDAFAWAVARAAYKLMAYKDEYEVARLYSDGRFRALLKQEFEGVRRLRIHLAPPMLSGKGSHEGRPRKMTLGPWMFPVLRVLAGLKRIRESPLDPFARTAERKLERDLRDAYLAAVRKLSATLAAASLEQAIELAEAPGEVRGFGPVKAAAARSLLEQLSAVRGACSAGGGA
jgi:indolepyruvate ferredoxin oxidoreductase